MAAPQPRFGSLSLVFGPESFLAERALGRIVADLLALEPTTSVTETAAEDLSAGRLQEITGADLFASTTIAVVRGLERLPKDLAAPLTQTVADLPEFVALVAQHGGGNAGKATLDALKKAAGHLRECAALKPGRLGEFVRAEAAAAGGSIDGRAAQQLVDAVGTDSRSLAAAVAQLLADSTGGEITATEIRRYFAGRASVTSFAVADDCLDGRTGQAIEKLRWALVTGTAPVLITTALANALRQLGKYRDAARQHQRGADIAAATGVPFWKVDRLAGQARAWDEAAVGEAIRAVARADADVKGAASDPAYALERLVLTVAGLRRGPVRRDR